MEIGVLLVYTVIVGILVTLLAFQYINVNDNVDFHQYETKKDFLLDLIPFVYFIRKFISYIKTLK